MASRRRRSTAQNQEAPPAPTPPAKKTASGAGPAEIVVMLIACVAIVWRAQGYPIEHFPTDWVVIVSAYAIFSAFAGRTRVWAPVTVLTMGALFVIFAQANLPKTLGMFQWLP